MGKWELVRKGLHYSDAETWEKGAVVERRGRAKTGKRIELTPLPRGGDGDVYNYLAEQEVRTVERKVQTDTDSILIYEEVAAAAGS